LIAIDHASLRVLLADRHRNMRQVVRMMLHGLGARRIAEASDGAEALEATSGHAPDIIIADVDLDVITGIELTRMLRRSDTKLVRTVSVILTASAPTRGDVVAMRNAGANEVLVKPFSIRHLADRIRSCVLYPRPFIDVPAYVGPCRRRFVSPVYAGPDRRAQNADMDELFSEPPTALRTPEAPPAADFDDVAARRQDPAAPAPEPWWR